MKTHILLGIFCSILILSCGRSEQQQAIITRAIADSVYKIAAAEKSAQDSINALNAAKDAEIAAMIQECEDNKVLLSDANARLKIAYNDLEEIKTFHLGRVDSEKKQQVDNQMYVIQGLEDQISELKNKLSQCK